MSFRLWNQMSGVWANQRDDKSGIFDDDEYVSCRPVLRGADLNPTDRWASPKGFLPISLAKYLELLDWTGRQIRPKKRGSIPEHLAPILERLELDSLSWSDLVQKFGKLFKRAARNQDSLTAEAARRGQRYMHGPGTAMLSVTG